MGLSGFESGLRSVSVQDWGGLGFSASRSRGRRILGSLRGLPKYGCPFGGCPFNGDSIRIWGINGCPYFGKYQRGLPGLSTSMLRDQALDQITRLRVEELGPTLGWLGLRGRKIGLVISDGEPTSRLLLSKTLNPKP